MPRLIIGCGRSRAIYYNPLYLPKPGTSIDVYDVHSHDPHGANDVTMDVDELMHPDIVGSIITSSVLTESATYQGYFDTVIFEFIPGNVLDTEDKCLRAFTTCYRVMKSGGTLSVQGGADMRPGSIVYNAVRRCQFQNVHNSNDALIASKQ